MAERLTAERLQKIRAEVRDKLLVVYHGCHSTTLQRDIHRQQCEDFLVEMFETEAAALLLRVETAELERDEARASEVEAAALVSGMKACLHDWLAVARKGR